MKRARVLAAVVGMVCLCGVAEAQRNNNRNNNEQDNFNQNQRQRNRGGGGGFNNFNDFGGGGRRGRFNSGFYNNSNIQVAEGDYSIIATKSIFLRDRREREVPQGPVYVDPRTLPPEQLLVVTGVVFEEGGFHAYVEHLIQGGLTRVTVGNEIARGVVDEIRMDGFMYKQEGAESKFIGVAHNLEGTRVASVQGERMRLQTMTGGGGGGGGGDRGSVLTFTQESGGGQFNRAQFGGGGQFGEGGGGRGNRGGGNRGGGFVMPTVPPPPLVNDPSMSVEERMRMRRMQEGQPGAPVVAAPVVVEEIDVAPVEVDAAPAAAGTTVDVDSLTNLTVEERMKLRRAQELGQ